MNEILAVFIYLLSLFGPGWSPQHKAYWEWHLGHKLEGYQEWRLSRNSNPYTGQPFFLGIDTEEKTLAKSPDADDNSIIDILTKTMAME